MLTFIFTLIRIYYLAILFVLSIPYLVVRFFVQSWRLRKFSGPFALPILGNCYTPRMLTSMKYLADLRKQYGSVYTFFALSRSYLVVCDPKIVRRILSDNKTFIKGYGYNQYFHVFFGNGLVTSNEEKHRHDRAIFAKYFIRSTIVGHISTITEVTVKAFDELGPIRESRRIDIETFFASLSLRTFMTYAFSQTLPQANEVKFCKQVSRGLYLVSFLGLRGIPLWDVLPRVQELKNVRKYVISQLEPIIEKRKNEYVRKIPMREEYKEAHSDTPKEDLGIVVHDDILNAMFDSDMSDQEIYDQCITMVVAGHDTTAYFVSYLCFLLGKHPDIQERVRKEIFQVLDFKGSPADLINGVLLKPDSLRQLKFLSKVMMETLRLYCVVPIVARTAAIDVHLEGHPTVPAGTEIILGLYIMNRDASIWENPNEFDPDRFTDEICSTYSSFQHGFFPFSYGIRSCIGSVLAQIESAIFICNLLTRYRIEPVPGFKPNITSGITLTTSNGIEIILTPLLMNTGT